MYHVALSPHMQHRPSLCLYTHSTAMLQHDSTMRQRCGSAAEYAETL